MTIDAEQIAHLYEQHINPGLTSLVKFMGFESCEQSARGWTVTDSQGVEYIDCLGGFGVFNFGHRHPRIVEAAQRQLDLMPLSCRLLFNAPQGRLAARLAEITPGDLQYCFFCNSGAEAVEGAIKFARLATGRSRIITTDGAFHGKTLGALSVGGRDLYQAPFQPLLPEVTRVPFGDLGAAAQVLDETTAAFIIEPIQGEAGIIVPGDDYLPGLRRACDDCGALLIADEIQTGMGRTGSVWRCDALGVTPDIMLSAKALGGGVMPIGAIIGTPRVWESQTENPLLHSSTFGGNPLACAVALAAIDVLLEENLSERAAAMGQVLQAGLESVRESFPTLIAQVRGRGLMLGVEFTHEDVGGLVIAALARHHVLAAYTLNNPSVIRFEPPLTIDEPAIEIVLERFRLAVGETAELVEGLL